MFYAWLSVAVLTVELSDVFLAVCYLVELADVLLAVCYLVKMVVICLAVCYLFDVADVSLIKKKTKFSSYLRKFRWDHT